MEQIIFPNGSVPVSLAAKIYGKDASWVRAGIVSGYLPIGIATVGSESVEISRWRNNSERTNYYISPKLLYEHTGYIWKGGKDE